MSGRYAACVNTAGEGSRHRGILMKEFTEFIRCHRPRLQAIALRLCHGGQDAEDLVQETLERALLHFSQLSRLHPNAQRAWLGRTLTCLFIDMCRRRQREELHADPVPMVDASHPHVAESNAPWERISPEQLCQAVDRLPEFLSMPFRLRQNGASYKAIARQLGASEGTVASWLFQARKQLKDMLMPGEAEVHP